KEREKQKSKNKAKEIVISCHLHSTVALLFLLLLLLHSQNNFTFMHNQPPNTHFSINPFSLSHKPTQQSSKPPPAAAAAEEQEHKPLICWWDGDRKVHASQKLPVSGEMPDIIKVASSHFASVKEDMNLVNAQKVQDYSLPVSVRKCKGKDRLQDDEELMPDVSSILKRNDDSCDEIGSTSFSGASHPPEPVDMDLMRPVCVPIGKKNSINGLFLEDLSIRVSGVEQSPSQNTVSSPVCRDSDAKECVWDVSLPPSGNVSPHSSIGSTGVITSMSTCTGTGTSTYRMSDGTLSVDRHCGITKIPLRGESIESGKTSISRASDSSGLSDESNWSSFTGGTNKPHKACLY
ncbi:hypothetical protein M8C21_029654, partial [Ambrosia artemisiifolia]